LHKLIVFSFLLVFIVACAPAQTVQEPAGCTEEAKLCPDGSSVGRVGPDCEFAPCPEAEQIFCTADVMECPDGSYVSRQPPDCAFKPCPNAS
jgi:hypothetical protein